MQLLSRDIDEDVPYTLVLDHSQNKSSLSSHKSLPANMPQFNAIHGPDSPSLKRIKGFSYDMFLFSAVVGNSSSVKPWDTIVIQGWEHRSYENRTFGCCIKYKSGRLEVVRQVRKIHWQYRSRTQMPVKQYVCRSENYVPGDIPELVTLSGASSRTACHKLYNWYVEPTFAFEKKDQIGVCAKVRTSTLHVSTPYCYYCNNFTCLG